MAGYISVSVQMCVCVCVCYGSKCLMSGQSLGLWSILSNVSSEVWIMDQAHKVPHCSIAYCSVVVSLSSLVS